jgi:altronate hydrolase
MPIETIDFTEPRPAGEVPLHQVAIRLQPQDQVAIARVNLQPDTVLILDDDGSAAPPPKVPTRGFIPSGHKIALQPLDLGQPVRRYGQIIGFASRPIAAGEHIHTHNLKLGQVARDYAFGAEARPVSYVPLNERRTFMGYHRADGQVGVRNYLAVIATVNCAAHTCREIARAFTPARLAAYPHVDGVIALTHTSGCGIGASPDYVLLQRTLAGMARQPNIGAYLLVGLGCETNQLAALSENYGLGQVDRGAAGAPLNLNIQELGGIRPTVQAGIAAVEALLPQVNAVERTRQPISALKLAVECGGSDGWSGVTANPVAGLVADELVRQGGTVVISETPEIYGAEHLLTRRAISAAVGQRLVDKIRWWEAYVVQHGLELNNNPSPGNQAGGLTNIYEKSLGAVAKAGSTPLMAVYDYAEPITQRGFCFMDSPGYDPVSVTGKVAGGCNLVLFTTGRGSVFGFKPAPTIKICSNSTTYHRMVADMDVNAGQVLEGVPLAQVAAELLELTIATASGRPSKSEAQDVGEAEFIPWHLAGPV